MPFLLQRFFSRNKAFQISYKTIDFLGSIGATHTGTAAGALLLSGLRDENSNQPTLATNDLLVAIYSYAGTTDRTQGSMLPTLSDGLGGGSQDTLTAAHTDLYANDANDANLQASYTLFDAGLGDDRISIPGVASGASCTLTLYAFRDIDLTTPLDVTPTTATNTNTGIPNCPSITPITPKSVILAAGVGAHATGTALTNPANLSGTTNHFRAYTANATQDAASGVGLKDDWAGGAFDPGVFGGGSSANTGSWCAVTIAIRPAVE